MLSLTKKTDYALIALSYLAERSAQTVSAREISTAFEMPAALVMNILKTLHHHGVLTSTRGTKGGYRLCTDLGTISVHDLIQMLEGPVALTECSAPSFDPTAPRRCKVKSCPVSGLIRKMHAKIVDTLKGVKVSDLMRAHVAAEGRDRAENGAGGTTVSGGGDRLVCGVGRSDS